MTKWHEGMEPDGTVTIGTLGDDLTLAKLDAAIEELRGKPTFDHVAFARLPPMTPAAVADLRKRWNEHAQREEIGRAVVGLSPRIGHVYRNIIDEQPRTTGQVFAAIVRERAAVWRDASKDFADRMWFGDADVDGRRAWSVPPRTAPVSVIVSAALRGYTGVE